MSAKIQAPKGFEDVLPAVEQGGRFQDGRADLGEVVESGGVSGDALESLPLPREIGRAHV